MAFEQYPEYPARVVRVIDADTYVLDVDLGFHVHTHIEGRLDGIDCPERNTPEGKRATAEVMNIFGTVPGVLIRSAKDRRTFARWVVDIWLPITHESLTDRLTGLGLVKTGRRTIPLRKDRHAE